MRRWLFITVAMAVVGSLLASTSRVAEAGPIPDCDRVGLNLAIQGLREQAIVSADRYLETARQYCPGAFQEGGVAARAAAEIEAQLGPMTDSSDSPLSTEVRRLQGLQGLVPDSLDNPTDTGIVGTSSAFFGAPTIFRRIRLNAPAAGLANVSTTTFGGTTFAQGGDFFGPDLSTLYFVTTPANANGNNTLQSLDMGSGAISQVGTITGVTGMVEDMTYYSEDCQMYLLTSSQGVTGPSQLYTIDLTNAQATLVSTFPSPGFIALTADTATGSMFAYGLDDALYRIDDPTVPNAINVGGTGLFWFFSMGQTMDSDATDGRLYFGSSDASAQLGGQWFNLDKNSAAATNLGFLDATGIPNGQIFTVAAVSAVELPEPTCEERQGVDPNRQLGRQVHLPILNFQGQDDVCRTWIEVQVIGPEPSKAVLVTWGEPGFCPPQCAGPLKVECSGLLIPGSTWNFLGAQVPTGSKSGILFKFTAAQLSEFGLDQVFGFDDVIADLMCETLFFGVVGDCDDYRRFKKAYNEGLEFAGINQVIAAGAGFLAVDVLRHCPGDVTPGVEVSGKYNGIAGDHLGAYDPVFGGFAYYAPLLYADKAGFNSIMYIQNGGLECSSVEIWFKAQDDCLRARICEIFTLAPGETYQFDATDCVGPDWQGSAWLRSSQPLGIVVDIIGRDVMMTYIGEPSQFFYAFDPLDPADDIGFSMGNQVAFGPLMYSEYQGWDSGVQVQNLSGIVAAKVKVYFLDRSGDIITTLVDWICPRGSQTFFLPVIANLPGNWVGSIRVESQEWWSPGDPIVSPPDIVGVVTLIKYNDAARTAATEALAYNLLPEHKIYIWQIGSFIGGTFSGVGLIAIPSLLKDLDATGVTSEVAIMNVIPKPGFTDFAIFIYDQNGLLDYICEKLNEKQVEYINLQTWGYVNPGFKGSAIISAVFWEHDVFSETGIFLRNLVGLGAVAVERSGTRLGEDVPGDEAAGDRGIPFQADENVSLEFAWGGPGLPNCPGVPPGFGFVPEDPESVGLSGN